MGEVIMKTRETDSQHSQAPTHLIVQPHFIIRPHLIAQPLGQNKMSRVLDVMHFLNMGVGAKIIKPKIIKLGQAIFALSLCLFFSTAQAQSVTGLTCSPSTIGGGTGSPATCTVTLSSAAPGSGTTVTLTSSLTELAASVPTITILAGQTAINFTVGTNPHYRRYSRLPFAATITAAANSTSRSAAINVTTQQLPTDSVISPRPDRSGPVCAGEAGILFNCPTGSGQCSVQQECTLGCENRPLSGNNWNDACATAGSVPIALNPQRIIGGYSGAGTLQLSSGAPADSFGRVSGGLIAAEPSRLNIPITTGATSHPFTLRTAAVNSIQFAPIDGSVTTPQALSGGGIFYASRSARTWVAVTPGTPPPVSPLSLVLENSSILGGQTTFGGVCINQLAPAPEIGNIAIILSSSHPTVASVPTQAALTQGGDCVSFVVSTFAIATNTTVTISAQVGTQRLTTSLLVTATPNATGVISFFLDPLMVTGGESSLATLVLDGRAPPSGFVVSLSSDNAVATLPASVTVPSGADRASFNIGTQQVSADMLVTLQASPSSSVTLAQLSVLAPVGAPTLTSLTINPSTVTGGTSTTGTVTLSSAALSNGATINLSSNSSAATVPTSVTVPVGATTAQFQINTSAVTANTAATLSASLGGIGTQAVTQIATLTVTPSTAATLSSVSLNPTSVVGGSASTGTVRLSAVAPSGGAIVTLSDNSTAVTVPTSVTVPAGATSANFTASSSTVTASTSATITATYSGVSRTAALTVNPVSTALPAPTLLSPANNTRFSAGAAITFDWSDVSGAASYTIEIDNSSTIAAPLTTTQTVTASQTAISNLPGQKMWWRVRANATSGAAGAWSAVRGIEVK